MAGFSVKARHFARRAVLQALYQWRFTGQPIDEIQAQFLAEDKAKTYDNNYFQALFQDISKRSDEIDSTFIPFLDREIESLTAIELITLRIGTYELHHRLDVPYRVVLNEALELSKLFGADEAYKYINGVLDKVAKIARQQEIDG